MNTLKLREFSEEQMRLGFPISSIAALQQAADTIDKLRAHCRQQRKELRRLNTAHCVELGTNPKHAGSDIEHRIVVMQQQVNSWHKGVEGALVTLREHVEALEENVGSIAAFVGCAGAPS